MNKPFAKRYTRKETYTVQEILQHVELNTPKNKLINFDGDLLKMSSDRYKVFKFKGISCVKCQCVGQYFIKEKGKLDPESFPYHFNLYAINKDGDEILMTKDHITPRSKGGKDHLSNYQPMCATCNSQKGNKEE
jgi:5-methylcytosine-specific restriction endonuclease McrA